MLVTGGSTNVTTYFAMRLAADGTAATGLTPADFDLQYVRSGAAPSTKVDATAGTAGGAAAHVDNTVVEPDATDQPGLYRVDWPDAAFAAGVREVILTVKVATAFTEHLRVQIDAVSTLVATDIVSDGTAITTSGGTVSTVGSCSSVTTVNSVTTLGADTINSSSLATSAVTEIQSGLFLAASAPTNFGDLAITVTTGQVSLLTATQASIDAIEADTNELQTDDYPTSIAALQTTANSIETDTQDIQTQVGTAGSGLSAIPVLSWVATTTDIWHEPTANIVDASTIGLQLKTNVDVASSTLSTLVATDIVSDGTAINTTAGVVDSVTTTVTNSDMVDISGLATASALTTAQADLTTITGTTGVVIDDAAITSTAIATTGKDTFANAVWDTLVLGYTGVSSFGGLVKTGHNDMYRVHDALLLNTTTIATLASQVSFTLTAGSTDDDAYNGMTIVVIDAATETQKAVGTVLDYTGSTKTITLLKDPAIFTMAAGDTVSLLSVRDPLAEPVAGSYASGTAGYEIGNNTASDVYAYFISGSNEDAFKADVSSLATTTALATAQADLDLITGADGCIIASGTQTFDMTGSITGSLSGSVDSVTNAVGSVTTDVTVAAASMAALVDLTWQEPTADHSGVSGSVAESLNAASSAGDPWTTALPGAYTSGQAGYVVGNMLDVASSTRSSQTTQDIMDAIVDQVLLDTTSLQIQIGTAGAGLTNVGASGNNWNTTTPPTAAAIADQVWVEILADHSGVSGSTAEAMNSASSAGDPWTTTLPGSYTGSQAGAVLNDVLTDTGTSLVTLLNDIPTTAEFEARTLLSANYFNAGTDGVIVTTNNDKSSYTISTAGMNSMSDVIWEEMTADHSSTSGSVAESLNAASSAGDPWTTSLPGSYTGTQAGKMLSDIIVDTAAVDAVTSQFVFTVANEVDANAVTGGGGDTAATIYNYFVSGSNETPFRATAAEIWGESLPGSYTSGEAGYLLGHSVTTSNPVISSTVIELDEGDTYDGTARAKLAWVVTKDYSAATSVTLEIWRTGDAGARTSMKSQAATVADATNINIADLDAGTWLADLVLAGCPAFEKLQFALVATWTANEETIAKGDVYVYGRE